MTFEIERHIDLDGLLEGTLTYEQHEALIAYKSEHTYTVEATVDRDDEIDGEPFTEDELAGLMLELSMTLPELTDEQSVDIWELIRKHEAEWFSGEFRSEVWDQYRSWCDGQESEREARNDDYFDMRYEMSREDKLAS